VLYLTVYETMHTGCIITIEKAGAVIFPTLGKSFVFNGFIVTFVNNSCLYGFDMVSDNIGLFENRLERIVIGRA
jgi:hypothetical protein